MKKAKRIISLSLILAIIALTLAGCGGGSTNTSTKTPDAGNKGGNAGGNEGKTYSFNLAMDSPEDTVTYLFGKKFADLVGEKSSGRIKVEVYSNGQLGGDREICENVQNGDLAFVVQNTAPQVNFVKDLAVFDLPNLFANASIARKVLDGPFFEEIAKSYEANNIKLLAYADQGFRTMTTNKKVEKIDDFKGQKIRTMENPYHLEYWKSLGANPTPMAFAEVYIGLQQGAIDAQENPYEVIVSAKLYEQQKYVVNTNHLLHLLSLITSPKIFNELSAEDQQIILDAAAEAKVYAREQADNRVADRVKIITDSGTEIVDLSDDLKAEMANRASSAYDKVRSAIGNELVDAMLKAVEEAK